MSAHFAVDSVARKCELAGKMKVPFSFLFPTFQSKAAKINRIADGGKVNVHSTIVRFEFSILLSSA